MIIERTKTITEEIDIPITGIKLLSKREARQLPQKILKLGHSYWLKDPGKKKTTVSFVNGNGSIYDIGFFADSEKFGVRPVIITDDFRDITQFKFANHSWTVISPTKALCDNTIIDIPFNEDIEKDDANDYNTSSIKTWLEEWLSNCSCL